MPKDIKKDSAKDQIENKDEPSIRICPACGYALSSMDILCPACRAPIEDERSSLAVHRLISELKEIDDQKEGFFRGLTRSRKEKLADKVLKKAQLIKSFPVPNSKRELLEFMTLSSANVNVKVLLGLDDLGLSEDEIKSERLLNQTWFDKMESVHQKAVALLESDPDLEKISAVYRAKKAEIEEIEEKQREKERRKKRKKHIEIFVRIAICVAAVILFIVLISTAAVSQKQKKERMEALVAEIREDVDAGRYGEALLKTNQVRMKDSSSEDEIYWDQIREDLVKEIEGKIEAEQHSENMD